MTQNQKNDPNLDRNSLRPVPKPQNWNPIDAEVDKRLQKAMLMQVLVQMVGMVAKTSHDSEDAVAEVRDVLFRC